MKLILIVEDDMYLRYIIRNQLEHENYQVIEAENGEEGFDLAKKVRPDLIISDIKMPVMESYDLLTCIRENPETANIPFIVLTVLNHPSERKLSEYLEANAFIVNPYILDEFLLTIKTLFNNQRIESVTA